MSRPRTGSRTHTQAADLRATGFGALLWRGEALDGRQIVAGADAVDRTLVAAGSLSLIHDAGDLARIPLRKKAAAKPPHIGDALVVQCVDRLLALARR